MIGNRLKLLRNEKNLTQDDLSKILNVSASSIGMYESNKREPSNEISIKIAEYFDVTVDYLIGKSDIRTPVDITNVKFANNGGIDTSGLTEDDIKEIKKQVEYMKWKNGGNK